MRLSARRLPGLATLALAVAASPALARPLQNSDLPPDLRDNAIVAHRPPAAPRPAAAGGTWHQRGEASYYRSSRIFARTSSGERYDENAMTAASPSLPLGTRVRVTREDTGRSVVVRINDRQAAWTGRVIDLSVEAARRLRMIEQGVGPVQITRLAPGEEVEVAEAPDPAATAPRDPRHTRRAAP